MVGVRCLSWWWGGSLESRRRTASCLAGAAAAVAILAGPRDGPVDRAYLSESRVNTWFTVVLPALDDPEVALAELGLPADCGPLVGRSWYDLGGDGGCSEVTRPSPLPPLPVLLQRPSALVAVPGDF